MPHCFLFEELMERKVPMIPANDSRETSNFACVKLITSQATLSHCHCDLHTGQFCKGKRPAVIWQLSQRVAGFCDWFEIHPTTASPALSLPVRLPSQDLKLCQGNFWFCAIVWLQSAFTSLFLSECKENDTEVRETVGEVVFRQQMKPQVWKPTPTACSSYSSSLTELWNVRESGRVVPADHEMSEQKDKWSWFEGELWHPSVVPN